MGEVIRSEDTNQKDDATLNNEDDVIEDETGEENESETFDYKALYKAEQDKSDRLMKQVDKVLDKAGKPADQNVNDKPRPAAIAFLEEAQLSDDRFDSVIGSKKDFVDLLNNFGNNVKEKTHEHMLLSLPSVVQNIVSYNIALNDINRKFFEENEDLLPVRKFVSATTDDLVKKRGIKDLDDYQDMLRDVPDRIRKELGMSGKTAKKDKGISNPSGQAAPGGRRVAGTKDANLTLLQKDIQKSLSYLKERG